VTDGAFPPRTRDYPDVQFRQPPSLRVDSGAGRWLPHRGQRVRPRVYSVCDRELSSAVRDVRSVGFVDMESTC